MPVSEVIRCASCPARAGRGGEQELVVLAAVQREVPLVPVRRAGEGAVGRAYRQLVRVQAEAHAAFLADVAEVAGDPVTDVDHGAGLPQGPDQRALPDARRGAVAARPRGVRVRLIRRLLPAPGRAAVQLRLPRPRRSP